MRASGWRKIREQVREKRREWQTSAWYYGGYYTQEEIDAGKPEQDGVQVRTWVIETKEDVDGDFYTTLDDEHKVSGDEIYIDTDTGLSMLPLGTVTIEETKAPTGYLLEGGTFKSVNSTVGSVNINGTSYYAQIGEEEEVGQLKGGNEYIQSDYVKRGDFEFTKKDDNSEALSVPFILTNVDTGESHTIYTDENGYFSTSSDYVAHSENTNAGTVLCGTWFGLMALCKTFGNEKRPS